MNAVKKYFYTIADKAFKTGPNGEQLLYLGGIWTRPLIIPPQISKEKIHKKLALFNAILLPAIIIPISFNSYLELKIMEDFINFIIYFVVIITFSKALKFLFFYKERKDFKRLEGKLTIKAFLKQTAERTSLKQIKFAYYGSIIFSLISVFFVLSDFLALPSSAQSKNSVWTMLVCGLFTIPTSFAWHYVLKVKESN